MGSSSSFIICFIDPTPSIGNTFFFCIFLLFLAFLFPPVAVSSCGEKVVSGDVVALLLDVKLDVKVSFCKSSNMFSSSVGVSVSVAGAALCPLSSVAAFVAVIVASLSTCCSSCSCSCCLYSSAAASTVSLNCSAFFLVVSS